jgi:hypothetical protein
MPEPDELKGMEPKDKETLRKKEEELADRERLVRERERELRTGVEQASVQEQIDAAMAEKKGGGSKSAFNLTSIIINVVLAAIVAYVMMGQFAITKSWYNTNIAPALNSFSDTYAQKSELSNYVTKGDFSKYATKDELPDLTLYYTQEEIDALLADVPSEVDLSGYYTKDEVDDLLSGESGGVYLGDTTRWRFQEIGFTDDVPDGVSIRVSSYDRIEEEGLYDIEVDIRYSDPTSDDTAPDVTFESGIEMILVPTDYVSINGDATYLDSDDAPWLAWDADFVVREREGADVCRRIIFKSDDYVWELEDGDEIELPLVLELVYH